VVVSSDPFNRSAIRTVTVVPLTTNLRLARAPGNVLVQEGTAGLDRDSVANVSQIVTVDRSELRERLGTLPQQLLAQLDNGLRLALDV